jgi:hypothetical protein
MVDKEPVVLDLCGVGLGHFYTDKPQVIGGINVLHEVIDELVTSIKNVFELKDDRLFALVADLLVENAIDGYLSEVMPRYKQELSDNRDFTFSLKIAVARELRLSPAKFFKGADVLRRIRNEFAHNLQIKTFNDLKPDLLREIDNVLNEYCPKKASQQIPVRGRFYSLVFDTVVVLILYKKHLHTLNAYLRDKTFIDNLLAFSKSMYGEIDPKTFKAIKSPTDEKIPESK